MHPTVVGYVSLFHLGCLFLYPHNEAFDSADAVVFILVDELTLCNASLDIPLLDWFV
jgi:hypothetical protein